MERNQKDVRITYILYQSRVTSHSVLAANNDSKKTERKENDTEIKKFIHKCMMFLCHTSQSHTQPTKSIFLRKLGRTFICIKTLI